MLPLKANNGLLNKLYIFIFYMSFLNSQNCLKLKDMSQLLYSSGILWGKNLCAGYGGASVGVEFAT